MTRIEALALGCAGAIAIAGLLVFAVVADGQTFGQRCAQAHDKGTDSWRLCVTRLATGEIKQP